MNCSNANGCHNGIDLLQNISITDSLFHVSNIAPLVSNDLKSRLELYINVMTFFMTSLFGVVANVINIRVYWKQGLKDSITLGFFSLSVSDLILVTMTLLTASCYAAKVILPDSNIDFPSIHYVSSGTIRNMVHSISSILTAVLSLERCCCVILPFKVKYIFTLSRTATIIFIIVAVHLICYIPFFATQELRWKPFISMNNTVMYKLRVHFSAQRPPVEKFKYIFLSIFTPTLSQIIVTISATILVKGLRESSKFRKTATMPSPMQAKGNDGLDTDTKNQDKDISSDNKMSLRDARLVRTMVFLVIILSISNVPLLIILLAQLVIPELNIGRPYQNTYALGHSIVYVLTNINASINIFVYYSNSARYREIVKLMLCYKVEISAHNQNKIEAQ